jgi:hypothetical protein
MGPLSRYCCPQFKNAFESLGIHGLAVGLWKFQAEVGGYLEFRTVDAGSPIKPAFEGRGNVTLAAKSGIKFCPWCGARLAEFYRRVEAPNIGEEPSL